jgi:SAM-dependent methyltransferase
MDYKDYLVGNSENNFWFKGKNQLINSILEKKIKKSNKKIKILSIGAGTGEELKSLKKFGEIYVVDIEKNALNLIPKSLCKYKQQCDACSLSFKDNFFDLIVSFDVFEHIPNDKLAVKECYRVLKPGGKLIFSVPAFQSLYSAHDKSLNHQRRYSKKNLKILLQNFKLDFLNYWNFVLFLPLSFHRYKNRNSLPKTDSIKLPRFLDSLFYFILKIENFMIILRLKTPPGLTIFGICTKK